MTKKILFLISMITILIFFFNNCVAGFEGKTLEDAETSPSSVPFEINNKSLAGRYHTYCENTSADDGSSFSSEWNILVIKNAGSKLNYKIFTNIFEGGECSDGEFLQSIERSSGVMKLNGTQLDITPANEHEFFGDIKANETLYTTITLTPYKFNFVITKDSKTTTSDNRLNFSMLEADVTLDIEAQRLDLYDFAENDGPITSYQGKYMTVKACKDLSAGANINDLLTTIDINNQIFSPRRSNPEAKIISRNRVKIFGEAESVPLEELFAGYQAICKSGQGFAPGAERAVESLGLTIRNLPVPGAVEEVVSPLDYSMILQTRELRCIHNKVFLKAGNMYKKLHKVEVDGKSQRELELILTDFCSQDSVEE